MPDSNSRPGTGRRAAKRGDKLLFALLAAATAHARHIALERTTLLDFQSVSPEVLWKCDATSIKRLGRFTALRRPQLQPFALDPTRRGNDLPAVLKGTAAGDFVVDILATRIDVLFGNRCRRCRREQADGNDRVESLRHVRRPKLDEILPTIRAQCRAGDQARFV